MSESEPEVSINLSPVDDKRDDEGSPPPSRCTRCLAVTLFGWNIIYNSLLGIFFALQIYGIHTEMSVSVQSKGWIIFLFILAYSSLLACSSAIFSYNRDHSLFDDLRSTGALIGVVIIVVTWFNRENYYPSLNLFYPIGWVAFVSPLFCFHHEDTCLCNCISNCISDCFTCSCPIYPTIPGSREQAERDRNRIMAGLHSHLQMQREIAAMNRPPPPQPVLSSYGW